MAGVAKRTIYRILNLESDSTQIATATTIAKAVGWDFEIRGNKIKYVDPAGVEPEKLIGGSENIPLGLAMLRDDKRLRKEYNITSKQIDVAATSKFYGGQQEEFDKTQWLEIVLIIKRFGLDNG